MGIKTIAFGGDTSLGYRYFQSPKWEPVLERVKNDPTSFFSEVKPSLEGIDHLVLNLETVISETEGVPAPGKLYCGIDDPENTLKCLSYVGAKTVSLANNHAMDFGVEKLLETIVHLQTAGIEVIGAGTSRKQSLKPAVIKVNEGSEKSRNVYVLGALRASKRYSEYGFFAKSNKAGLARTTASRIDEAVKNIKEKDPSGFVVYYPHWQGCDYGSVTDVIAKYCRDRVDNGVDLIIGHGTHTIGNIESYKGVLILHSIGNFVFNTQGQFAKTDAPPFGMIVKLEFKGSSNLDYPELKILPLLTNNRETSFRTTSKAAVDQLERSGIYKSALSLSGISFQRNNDGWLEVAFNKK